MPYTVISSNQSLGQVTRVNARTGKKNGNCIRFLHDKISKVLVCLVRLTLRFARQDKLCP